MISMTKRTKRKNRLGSGIRRPKQPVRVSRVSRIRWAMLLVSFAILVAAITKRPGSNIERTDYDGIDPGDIALSTVVAELKFQSEDIQATREERDAAAGAVPDMYRVNDKRVQDQVAMLNDRIAALEGHRDDVAAAVRAALLVSDSSQPAQAVARTAVMAYAEELVNDEAFGGMATDVLATWLMPSMKSLPVRQFEPLPGVESDEASAVSDEAVATAAPRKVTKLQEPEAESFQFAWAELLRRLSEDGLAFVLQEGIVRPNVRAESFPEEGDLVQNVMILRDLTDGELKSIEEKPLTAVLVPGEARGLLRNWFEEHIQTRLGADSVDPVERATLEKAAYEMARDFVVDTLDYDQVATARERERARSSIEPTKKWITAGAIIQREGKRWTEQSLADVKAHLAVLESGERHINLMSRVLAHMILAGLILLFLVRSVTVFQSKRTGATKTLAATLLLLCATAVVGRIASYFVDLDSGLLVPVAAAAVLLAILTVPRVAATASLALSILLGIQYNYDITVFAVACAMSLAGVFSIASVRRRGDINRALWKATAAGLAVAAAMSLATDSLFSEASLHRLVLIGLNGMLCVFIVPGLLSPLERLFRVTTDFQLLEYSNLNNEVLSQMAIEVPATYAHSLMVGQIAAAAADAIGANGLLARVCAYYHDIGKMRRPEYFSENQTDGNIHDELSPRHSSRAIASHVTQGVEMAREYHLPDPVVDAILEHHGTCLISFFYKQALERQKHGDVKEEDFRYPGPKPQSRETAILMICDAVESGVRSLRNPNEERVREFVDRIIRSRWEDRQFDECALTLRDLDKIAEVVTSRILTGMHTRIAYPEPERDKEGVDNVIPLSGGQDR